MRTTLNAFLQALFLGASILGMSLAHRAAAEESASWTYHAGLSRSGNFVVPSLTWERARTLHLDRQFQPEFSGHVYAQPLLWHTQGSKVAMLIVATEDDMVYALDSRTGAELWRKSLGKPVSRSQLPCGNIDPLGITGTPVIDPVTATIYLDAVVDLAGPHHLVFALALKDGAILDGWPIDVGGALKTTNQNFDPAVQNERGALTILDGTLFVPFGGHYGDCGQYHGWVVGFPLNSPQKVTSWKTRALRGGIWAPGGISSDGQSLFVATGNTFGARTWNDGEAIERLPLDLRAPSQPQDYFAPSNWLELDRRDADLGGSNPLPLDIPTLNGVGSFLLALGKDGRAYLLDRKNLGGIGGSIAEQAVSSQQIHTSAAGYPASDGFYVAFQGRGSHCPIDRPNNALTALKIGVSPRPSISTVWCGAFRGAGAAIVTTTDGHSNPIVWILGAEGDNRLHGFRGDTGETIFDGGARWEVMYGLRHFESLLATEDRIYAAADGRVYAFAF